MSADVEDSNPTEDFDRDPVSVNWDAVVLAARLREMPESFVAISAASGVADSTLRNWVNDRVAEPSLTKVAAVARALDVPPRLLLSDFKVPEPSNLTFRRKAAELLGVSPSTLRRYCKEGTLPEPGWVRVGKRRQRSFSEQWIREARQILSQL